MTDNKVNYRLQKHERISGVREIESLFARGKAFLAFPLRVVCYWQESQTATLQPDVAILVSVGKKRFKRAVDRNRLKRLIREAYRLNKDLLLANPSLQKKRLRVSFAYIHQEKLSFYEVEKGMKKALESIVKEMS